MKKEDKIALVVVTVICLAFVVLMAWTFGTFIQGAG